MLVETFEIQEVDEQSSEQNVECLELLTELELIGQRRFYAQESEGDGVFPYRKMTAQEKLVIQTLLPEATNLHDYSDAPMPLRVLQVAAHAKGLVRHKADKDYAIEVWHPSNADYKDPYLVLRDGEKYGRHQYYILARWGDELDNFNTMIEAAKKILAAKRQAALAQIKAGIEAAIHGAGNKVELAVLTGKWTEPHFSDY